MTINRSALLRAATTLARRRLARVLVVVAVAAAGVLTLSGAAGAASVSPFNEIRNAGNNMCLDVAAEDGYYNVGARVQQYHCTGAQEQKWRAIQINNPIGGFATTWEFVSQRSGLCLGRGAFTNNGQQAIQMGCDGSAQVAWVGGNLGNGNYYLDNLFNNGRQVLDVSGNSSADHAKIQLWEYNGSKAQQWRSSSFFPPAF